MSAHQVEDNVYASVEATLNVWLAGSTQEGQNAALALGIKYRTMSEEAIEKQVAEFVDALHEQNQRSVNYRYSEDTPIMKRPQVRGQWLNALQMYRTLETIDYQCCETPGYRDLAITKKLTNLTSNMASLVISRMPEYDAAAWWYERRRTA